MAKYRIIPSREKLIEYIKAIGQKIIDDAEEIAPELKDTCSFEIKSGIYPSEVIQVEYTITKNV